MLTILSNSYDWHHLMSTCSQVYSNMTCVDFSPEKTKNINFFKEPKLHFFPDSSLQGRATLLPEAAMTRRTTTLTLFNSGIQQAFKLPEFHDIFPSETPELDKFIDKFGEEIIEICEDPREKSGWSLINGGATKYVAIHHELPNYVFKSLRHSKLTKEEQAEILRQSMTNYERVREICKKENLDKVRIPQIKLLTEIDGIPVAILVEETLPISYKNSVQTIIDMNKNKEDQLRLNELFRQKAVLVYRSGLTDIKENNMGIGKDAVLVVDVDTNHGFSETTYKTLIAHAFAPNIAAIQQGLVEADPEYFKNFPFDELNKDRLVRAEWEEKFEEFKLNKYTDSAQTIDCPNHLLEKLSPPKKMLAEHLLGIFNQKIANKDFFWLDREVSYQSGTGLSWDFKKPFIELWKSQPENSDKIWYQEIAKLEKEVLGFFIKEGIIYGYDDRMQSHCRLVYC